MAGVDLAVGERPRNWLRPAPSPVEVLDVAPSDTLPETLDAFIAWLATGGDAALLGPIAQRVAPAGDRAAALMILADMPGVEDAPAGRLFDGPVAPLFERMLAAIGTTREAVWLAPLFPARPAGGADATRVSALAEIARRHVALVRPRRLLLMGKCAGEAMLGDVPARGSVHRLDFAGTAVATVATFGPAALLDSATLKPAAWADLRLLMGEDL